MYRIVGTSLGADAPFEASVNRAGEGTCPVCSYLSGGMCHWCPDKAQDIPGCEECVGHQMPALPLPPPLPWYKADWVIPTAVGVGATVVASIITAVVMQRMHLQG